VVDVSVTVVESGATTMSVALTGGTNANFGNINVNAVGDTSTGLVDAGSVTFTLGITNDTKLYRDGSHINITLGDGSAAGANLNFIGTEPTFLGANQVDFQIPGRYLSVEAMNNPQQAKYTGGQSSSGPIWTGSNPPNAAGRVPRVAGNVSTGKAIYKIGDIFGTFNSDSEGCRVTTGNTLMSWTSSCGDASFGENHITKQIAGIYPGSGFVQANHQVKLALDVPAGVYPGLYEADLTVEQSFS
jgi:hypothetical protein